MREKSRRAGAAPIAVMRTGRRGPPLTQTGRHRQPDAGGCGLEGAMPEGPLRERVGFVTWSRTCVHAVTSLHAQKLCRISVRRKSKENGLWERGLSWSAVLCGGSKTLEHLGVRKGVRRCFGIWHKVAFASVKENGARCAGCVGWKPRVEGNGTRCCAQHACLKGEHIDQEREGKTTTE